MGDSERRLQQRIHGFDRYLGPVQTHADHSIRDRIPETGRWMMGDG
jgi:hypothetical protein